MNNPPIKCILVDDEQLAIDTLCWQLEEFCTNIQVVNKFTNPVEAHAYLASHPVDLCFLDIDMPECTGFDFLGLWHGTPPFDVIFTTAYSEYAIKAFKVSAIDYLLKPIDEEDLVATIKRYQKSRQSPSLNDQLAILMEQLKKPISYSSRIALPTMEGIHLVNVTDIMRLAAHNNYTFVHLDKGASILVSKTLKEVEKMLSPELFIRVHQSHTIPVDKIKIYQRGRGGSVILFDGTVIPVSKGQKELLMEKLDL